MSKRSRVRRTRWQEVHATVPLATPPGMKRMLVCVRCKQEGGTLRAVGSLVGGEKVYAHMPNECERVQRAIEREHERLRVIAENDRKLAIEEETSDEQRTPDAA